MTSWIVIGISGVTCGGKTTLAKKLHTLYPNNAYYINMDKHFLSVDDPRHQKAPGLNHNNWELLTALDTENWKHEISSILEQEKFHSDIDSPVPNFNGSSLDEIQPTQAVPKLKHNVLILDGFIALNDKWTASQCNLKFYVTLTKDQCWERRQKRNYDPADIPGYFEACVWPQHVAYKAEVIANNPDLVLLDGSKSSVENLDIILNHIAEYDVKLP